MFLRIRIGYHREKGNGMYGLIRYFGYCHSYFETIVTIGFFLSEVVNSEFV